MTVSFWDYMVITSLMKSLEDAFLARQGIPATQPGGWGDRVLSHLEQHHSEWVCDILWVYAAAQQMLRRFMLCQGCEGLSYTIYRRPDNFLDGVLLHLGKPRIVPN